MQRSIMLLAAIVPFLLFAACDKGDSKAPTDSASSAASAAGSVKKAAAPAPLTAEDKALAKLVPELEKCDPEDGYSCPVWKKLTTWSNEAHEDKARQKPAYLALIRLATTAKSPIVRATAALAACPETRQWVLLGDPKVGGRIIDSLRKGIPNDKGDAAVALTACLAFSWVIKNGKDPAYKKTLVGLLRDEKLAPHAISGLIGYPQHAGRLVGVKTEGVEPRLIFEGILKAKDSGKPPWLRKVAMAQLGTAVRHKDTPEAMALEGVNALKILRSDADKGVVKRADKELKETTEKKSVSKTVKDAAAAAMK